MRHSLSRTKNPDQRDWTRGMQRRGNADFFTSVQKAMAPERKLAGAIGLVGGLSLAAYSTRHAQSVLRWDLQPSYWSHCFLIVEETSARQPAGIWECTLEPRSLDNLKAERNGVGQATLADYTDTDRYPNAAVISFLLEDSEIQQLIEHASDPNIDRSRFNLWELIGRWFPYVWRMSNAPNPLSEGYRLPSAGYLEWAFETIGLDLAPGASERNSSPEHLWQTAQWWWQPFEALQKNIRIDYCIRSRQPLVAPAATPYLTRRP